MLKEICEHIADSGGTPYYVGGCVRDELLRIEPKDFDIEVFNISPDRLKQILSHYGTLNDVGVSFGVIKLKTPEGETDFSTPRRDNKVSRGHRGFVAELDPLMCVNEAASRRDFTINAIYKNAVTGEIVDHFRGVKHLEYKLLIAVSEHYEEDPLRVLRAMQLASRFRLKMTTFGDTSYMSACMASQYNSLPKERVGEEWRKWAKGNFPRMGLEILSVTGWQHCIYHELNDMVPIEQDPIWHPEGQLYFHVKYVCDAMADICTRENIVGEDREVFMFAALCHDMGKVSTTTFDGDPPRWRARGHAEAGVPIAEKFLQSIGIYQRVIDRVLPLVAEHMYPVWTPQTRRTVRRLKVRLGELVTINDLLLVMEADQSGRFPLPPGKPKGYEEIVKLNEELPPIIEPIITGRHIMQESKGVIQGKNIGEVKRRCFEAQLEEEFDDFAGGLNYLKGILYA